MKRLWKDYGLSITLGVLFLVFLVLQAWFNYQEWQSDSLIHGEALEVGSYLTFFLGRVFENAQSEMLQLFSFVVLTAFLIHRGSHESRDGQDRVEEKIDAIRRKLEI